MRILYHHRTSGSDAQGVHIQEMVAAFRCLGHEVSVAALADSKPAAERGHATWKRWVLQIPFGYEVVQLLYNLVGVSMLLRHWRREPFDFLFERYALLNFAGVVTARLMRRPVILEVNAPLAMEQHREGVIRLLRLARWIERCILNSATRVIAVSGPLRDILVQTGVESGRIAVVPNGVNPDRFQPVASALHGRREYGLEGRVVIGCVGWFRPWHGVELLLEAFHRHAMAARGAVLLLVGDGPAMPALRSYTLRHGLQECVRFTGAVPHDRIPEYLSLIDIATQPAANEYCCPMKIIEYMALGKAIVAPRQPNVTELLEDDRQALLFQPGDSDSMAGALGRLLEDPAARARLGKAASAAIHQRRLLWTENARAVLEMVDTATRSASSVAS